MPCPCKAMRRSGGIQGQHAAAAPFRFVPLAPRIDPLLNSSLLQIHCFCYWIWMDATGKGRCSAWSSTASACSVRRTTKNALASSHPENQGTTLFVRPLDHAASGHGTQFSLPLLLHEGIKKKGLLAYGQTPHMAIPFLDDDFCSACMVWFWLVQSCMRVTQTNEWHTS